MSKSSENNPLKQRPDISATNSPENKSQELTGWQPYNLDHYAQKLILKYRDQKDVLNETHKMRMSIAYGLERFWGEHLRLKRENKNKSKSAYWKDVWNQLTEILKLAGVDLPNDEVNNETDKIEAMAHNIWSMEMSDRRIALMVLTQFCDSLVWWKQRYNKGKDS